MDKKYTVTNHKYLDTGGNSMVSVFTVYDRTVSATRYVICGDEGLNWQSLDTITDETLEDLSYDDAIIETHNYDELTNEPRCGSAVATMDCDKFQLFKYCEFEHYKRDCRYFGIRIQLSVDRLPAELYDELDEDVIEWHKKNGDFVTTDGYQVWPSEGYEPPAVDEYLNDIKSFSEWFDGVVNDALADDYIGKLYGKPITLVFNGRALQLSFGAVEYGAISDALKQIIDEQ